jgi:hypothetical protein
MATRLESEEEVSLMASPPDPIDLSGEHRHILSLIFRHPTSHNIEWHDVLSLLNAVGTVKESSDGNYVVTIGGTTQGFRRPRQKDIDTAQVVELRNLLGSAGYRSIVDESDT